MTKFSAACLCAFVLIAFGWSLARWLTEPVIEIKEITVTETRYIRPAETERELRDCYESPITIEAEMRDNSMYITAGDGCKQARAQVMLDCEPRPPDLSRSIIPLVISAAGGALLMILIL